MEPAVSPADVVQLRHYRDDLRKSIPVGLEVVLSAQHEVVDPGRAGDCRIHAGGSLLGLAHLASADRQHCLKDTRPPRHIPAATPPPPPPSLGTIASSPPGPPALPPPCPAAAG